MDYLFFGIQGSGKGTQTRKLETEFGLAVFETGAELRNMAASGTELGKKVKSIIEAGELVPTEIVMAIVEQFVNENQSASCILFDGIPRSSDQQGQLHKILKIHNRQFSAVSISLSDEEALTRLLARGRSDDNPESIKTRIQNFYDKTLPILEYYKANDSFIEINGDQSIDQVYSDLKSALKLS